jgi:hypothetical protein
VETYLGGGNGPNLEVVWSHEEVGNSDSHLTHDPLIEGLRLRGGDTSFQCGVNQTINALDLLLLGQHGNVVLERIRDPLSLAANVGDTLVRVPVIRLGKSLVDAVVKVLVVREDDMATNIVELQSHVC